MGRYPLRLWVAGVGLAALSAPAFAAGAAGTAASPAAAPRVMIFVWDGLRPDLVSSTDTPNLLALARRGVTFTDNHATYPTITMINAASFATGAYPETNGFFGNTTYVPGARGTTGKGREADFSQPISTEDYGVLEGLNTLYDEQLFEVPTLFQAAQRAGLKTAAVGKSGPVFLQDYRRGGVIVDERMAWPLDLARGLQAAGFSLPRRSPLAFQPGTLSLAPDNGDPTAPARRIATLADGVTADPTDVSGSPYDAQDIYLMEAFSSYVLPQVRPELAVVWLRNPDGTEHAYGVNGADARDALHAQDALLGRLEGALADCGLASTTDLIVVSDHGHSNVAGPAALFPTRAIRYRDVGRISDTAGYSVSGAVRLADLLTRAGFLAYDGGGCGYDPVLSGIKADGERVYPPLTDEDGSACGCRWAGKRYTTGGHEVPHGAVPRAALVVAANGGSDYVYVPDHDPATVARLVRFLQSREEVGAIFVAARYAPLPGTLPLAAVRAQDRQGRNPDVILSYAFDENAVIAGIKGTEFEGTDGVGERGIHGSFSPADVHNVLIAYGPHFRAGLTDHLPSGNVDLAPTVARILGIELPQADGRPLLEALRDGARLGEYSTTVENVDSTVATGLRMRLPTSPSGADVDGARSTYRIHLQRTVVHLGKQEFTYFDFARAIRE
jgi:arylsulfatase A-like enzyme